MALGESGDRVDRVPGYVDDCDRFGDEMTDRVGDASRSAASASISLSEKQKKKN